MALSDNRINWSYMFSRILAFSVALVAASTQAQVPDFRAAGEAILDGMIAKFRNAANGLYAEKIDSAQAIVTDYGGTSFVWPASHVLRALRWGSRVNPGKYARPFRDYVYAVYRYKGTALGRQGYAVLPGSSELFFDDNAVMLVEMALAQSEIPDPPILADAVMAYDFCNLARDAQWGIPQIPAQLGKGMFYSMAISPVAHGAALLYRLTGKPEYLSAAKGYYEALRDPVRLLRDTTTELFNQYTFHVDGRWSYSASVNGSIQDGRGFRAYQSTYVIRLALELHRATGDARYLREAESMTNACLKRSYTPGKGLAENAFWGGNDLSEVLEALYESTKNPAWHETARDIVGRLIAYGKDRSGWYPSDENDARGDWNVDRRAFVPGATTIMGQAAAASAILQVAWYAALPVGIGRTPARAHPGTDGPLMLRQGMPVWKGPIPGSIHRADGKSLPVPSWR